MQTKLLILLLFISAGIYGQKIFPGAEGFGTDSRGAYSVNSNPSILIVDTLAAGNFSTGINRGTFEWAVSQNCPRIILFEVGGVIDYRNYNIEIVIRYPYCNIYGQSAPHPGITILGAELKIYKTHDILIQHITSRLGDDLVNYETFRDAFINENSQNIIVDHCTFSWSQDEVLDIYGKNSKNVTISNCIIAEPLRYSYLINKSFPNNPQKHGLTALALMANNVTFLRNLFAYGFDRNPMVDADTVAIINNLSYTAGYVTGALIRTQEVDQTDIAYIGNVIIPVENWNNINESKYAGFIHSSVSNNSDIFVSDNLCPRKLENSNYTDWENMRNLSSVEESSDSPVNLSDYTIYPSESIESYVLNNAGARYWSRTVHDKDLIQRIINRQGEYTSSPIALTSRAYNRDPNEGIKTKNGNMKLGYDWSIQNEYIIINGKQINLNVKCNNIEEVLELLNSSLPPDVNAIKHWHPDCYHIVFQTVKTGRNASIEVSGNGLSTFGIAPGIYYGEDGVGGYPDYLKTSRVLNLPENPHGDSNNNGYTNLEEWAYGNCEPQDQAVTNSPPVIQNQEISVVNTVKAGMVIGTIEAFDPDQGQSVTYSIIKGNSDILYSVNSFTGELTIENALSQSTVKTDSIIIRVEDDAAMSLSATATITIKIFPGSKMIFIDPTNKNDLLENGSLEHPYDSWNDIEWKEGYSYLQKRGTTAFEQKMNIESGNLIIGSYGEGDMPEINSSATDFAFRVYEKSNVSITDLHLFAPDAISCIYILGSSCDSNSVQNCVLEGSVNGVRIIDGKKVICKYNTFKNKGDGIYSYAQQTEIYYNIFIGNQLAINISSNLSEANIYNNIFYNNREAITTSYASLTLYNNIFYLVNQSDIAIRHQTDKLISDYNIYYPEQEGFINISDKKYNNLYSCTNVLGIDVHSFSDDPMFIDIYNENFHLLPQSPAIDAGTYVGLIKDYTGNSVPNGNATDIGLFETCRSGDDLSPDFDDSLVDPVIFPNPCNGQFNIDLNNNQAKYSKLRINNIAGTQILQLPISENNYDISVDISNFPSGIYILNLFNATGVLSKMIIVK